MRPAATSCSHEKPKKKHADGRYLIIAIVPRGWQQYSVLVKIQLQICSAHE